MHGTRVSFFEHISFVFIITPSSNNALHTLGALVELIAQSNSEIHQVPAMETTRLCPVQKQCKLMSPKKALGGLLNLREMLSEDTDPCRVSVPDSGYLRMLLTKLGVRASAANSSSRGRLSGREPGVGFGAPGRRWAPPRVSLGSSSRDSISHPATPQILAKCFPTCYPTCSS